MPLTPHECIQEALIANAEPDPSVPKERQMFELCDAVLQYLDAEGFTLIQRDAVWNFHDDLNYWLNQDPDEHRLSTFTPYEAWLEVLRRLPPRRDGEGNIVQTPMRRR